MRDAAADLRHTVMFDLQGDLSADKAAVSASTPALACGVSNGLGKCGRDPSKIAVNLGIGDLGEARRATLNRHGSKRRIRWSNALARQRRIAKVRSRLSRNRNMLFRIHATGTRPALEYGGKVLGYNDMEAVRFRRVLLSATAPVARGTSLTAKAVIKGDPSAPAVFAPVLAWAGEAWRAATCSHQQQAHFSIKDLNTLWHQADPQRTCNWKDVRGPIAAMYLSFSPPHWMAYARPFHSMGRFAYRA